MIKPSIVNPRSIVGSGKVAGKTMAGIVSRHLAILQQRSNVNGSTPFSMKHDCLRAISKTTSSRVQLSTSAAMWDKLYEAAKMGNGELAERFIHEMVENCRNAGTSNQNTLLDSDVLSLALAAWANSDEDEATERAHRLLRNFSRLQQVSSSPSRRDYHIVLRCWANPSCPTLAEQAVEKAEQLLEMMEGLGADQRPTIETFELYLSILANAGYASRAQSIVTELFGKQMSSSSCSNTTLPATSSYVQPTIKACNSVLEAWKSDPSYRSANEAELFLKQMLRHFDSGTLADRPDLTSFNSVFECFSKASSLYACHNISSDNQQLCMAANRVKTLFDRMTAINVRPNVHTYNFVISTLAEAGLADEAERLLTRLTVDYSAQFDAELKPNIKLFQTVLLAWTKCRNSQAAERAESFLKHMNELYDAELLHTKPDVSSYNMVLKLLAKEADTTTFARGRALKLLEQMYDNDISPNVVSINCVMDAYGKSGTANETEELLWHLYEKHVEDPDCNPQPDVISFTTAIVAWGRSGSSYAPDKVSALFARLKEMDQLGRKHCKPDVVTYAATIECWAKSRRKGAANEAEAILRQMQAAKRAGDESMQPDAVCWNSVINAWAQAGNGERAEALLHEMFQGFKNGDHFAQPTNTTFTAVLSAWAKTRHHHDAPGRAQRVLQQMREMAQSGVLDVKPNFIHTTIVLDCLANVRKTWAAERAEAILQEMARSDDRNELPSLVSYNCVIKAWSYTRHPQAVARVVALLRELLDQARVNPELRPTTQTFGSVLKTIADSRLPDMDIRAKAVLSMMDQFGAKLNKFCATQLRRCNVIVNEDPVDRPVVT